MRGLSVALGLALAATLTPAAARAEPRDAGRPATGPSRVGAQVAEPELELAPAPAPAPAPSLARPIEAFDVVGLVELELPFVRLSVESVPGTALSTRVLEADVDRLLATGLFRSVAAAWEPLATGGARVRFEVVEAPPVVGLRVVGASLVDPARLLRELDTGRLAMPDPAEAERIATVVREAYTEAGWLGCGLAGERPFELGADGILVVRVVESRLASVTLTGLRRVNEVEVRRRLGLRFGEPVRTAELEAALARLAALDAIADARFSVARRDQASGELHLALAIEEDPYRGELEAGLRYEKVAGPLAGLRLTRRDLFDRGLTLDLRAEGGSTSSYSAELSREGFLGLDLDVAAGLHDQTTRREERRGSLVTSRFLEERTGQGYRLGRFLRRRPGQGRLVLSLRDEVVNARSRDGSPLPNDLTLISGNPFEARYPQQTVGLGYETGPAGMLAPDQPSAFRFDLEVSGGSWFRSPGDYTTYRVEGRWLFPIGGRTGIALRARAGAIDLRDGVLPFLERLSVGGSETLRGFLFREFTGDRMVLANLEWRRRLSPRLSGVAFADWGDAWERSRRGLEGFFSSGLGIRLDLKLFELRLDAARGAGTGEVRLAFGIGHLF